MAEKSLEHQHSHQHGYHDHDHHFHDETRHHLDEQQAGSASKPPHEKIDRHFTTATYVRHPTERKVLMLWHKKLNSWLPPGGHLHPNETPDEGAAREVFEETGLEVDFFPQANWRKADERASILPSPHHLQIEKIEPGHYHIDFVFFSKARSDKLQNGEQHELKWFSEQDIRNLPGETIFDNTREWALHALKEVR